MIITELFDMQKELDIAIAKNLGMEDEFNSVEIVDQRVFALKVELAEWANEVSFFKYWKKSHIINQAATLEEQADYIHFLLSIGNSRKYTFIKEIHPERWEKVPVGRLFIYLIENSYDSSGKWLNAFEQAICIGLKLGYTEEEMIQAYRSKNKENYDRIKRGY
ncbi:dUTP diphosphatase [Neobacillus niacini]|uniref:dUTP diphosphatase n=1 Tax=Neobacillus niacini TaxID=86668 RepID=UPI002FFE9614